MGKTTISWTSRTWNAIRGCSRPALTLADGSKVSSPGCQNCYAMTTAHRFNGPGQPYDGLTKVNADGKVDWAGKIMLVEDHLGDPLRWTKPQLVFVNSMSDVFHANVPREYVVRMFAVMARANLQTFQILTKRPERMAALMSEPAFAAEVELLFHESVRALRRKHLKEIWPGWPLPNVWLGTSVENQDAADQRIPHLLATPATIRFLSCEPLLGPVDLSTHLGLAANHDDLRGVLHWVIVGGESGHKARSMNLDWVRGIVAQCRQAGVKPFVKQLGEEYATMQGYTNRKGEDPAEWPDDLQVREYPEATVVA